MTDDKTIQYYAQLLYFVDKSQKLGIAGEWMHKAETESKAFRDQLSEKEQDDFQEEYLSYAWSDVGSAKAILQARKQAVPAKLELQIQAAHKALLDFVAKTTKKQRERQNDN